MNDRFLSMSSFMERAALLNSDIGGVMVLDLVTWLRRERRWNEPRDIALQAQELELGKSFQQRTHIL